MREQVDGITSSGFLTIKTVLSIVIGACACLSHGQCDFVIHTELSPNISSPNNPWCCKGSATSFEKSLPV